jgi:hypothetical protein
MGNSNSKYWDITTAGWVFLSHSSSDYEDVKIVRDYLEENNFNALMFYLKCLDHDPTGDETQNLIYREIYARNIFVLCDSIHAQSSDWVQNEVNYVRSFNNKIYVTLNIDNMKQRKCSALSVLDNLIDSSTLYLMYGSGDKDIVKDIGEFLSSEGFKVFFNNHIQKSHINDSIDEIDENSYLLLFGSKKSASKVWYEKTIEFLDSIQFKNVIFVYLDQETINNFVEKKVSDMTFDIFMRYDRDFNREKDNLLQMIKEQVNINIKKK